MSYPREIEAILDTIAQAVGCTNPAFNLASIIRFEDMPKVIEAVWKDHKLSFGENVRRTMTADEFICLLEPMP